MVEIQGISLVFTNKCNALCKHCGSNCGPDESGTMTIKDAKGYIKSAREFKSLEMVCFTGGEPLLFFDDVLEVMSYAFELGLRSEVVTNCFWAISYAVALEKLETLKNNGLINFVTSLDDYHMDYIKMEYVENAVKAALDSGLKVTIKTLEYDNCYIKAEDVKQILGISSIDANLYVQKVNPVAEGRFKTIKDKENLSDTDNIDIIKSNVDLSGGCSKIIRFPTVNAYGELYPCCGFGDKARFAGKYPKNNFYELLSMIQNNLLFNLLGTLGPQGVLELAEKHLNKHVEYEYDNLCELCNYLFSTEEIRKAVYNSMMDLVKT